MYAIGIVIEPQVVTLARDNIKGAISIPVTEKIVDLAPVSADFKCIFILIFT